MTASSSSSEQVWCSHRVIAIQVTVRESTMLGKIDQLQWWTCWFSWIGLSFSIVFISHELPQAFAQQGLSLSCGAQTGYTSSNIYWIPDDNYISVGHKAVGNGSPLRYFPTSLVTDPSSNLYCYNNLHLTELGPMLLRATFQYKNYDGINRPPKFQMWMGTTIIRDIHLTEQDPWVEEVIVYTNSDMPEQRFCLLAEVGSPVVSFLEVRPLPLGSYQAASYDNVILRKVLRTNCGELVTAYRYPEDPYDRIWDLDQLYPKNTRPLRSNVVLSNSSVAEQIPSVVVQTSRQLAGFSKLVYTVPVTHNGDYLVFLYFFADATSTANTTETTVSVMLNDRRIGTLDLKTPGLQQIVSDQNVTTNSVIVSLQEVRDSSPQINAIEVYEMIKMGPRSFDVTVLNTIKQIYTITSNWIHDPCLPIPWMGVRCDQLSAVTGLDLSFRSLDGAFTSIFANLGGLNYLNLSYNALSGPIPNLNALSNLQVLDMRNNSLTGTLNNVGGLGRLTELHVENNQLKGLLPVTLKSGVIVGISGNPCLEPSDFGCPSNAPPKPGSNAHSWSKGISWVPLIGGIGVGLACLAASLLLIYVLYPRLKHMTSKASASFSTATTSGKEYSNIGDARIFTYKELEVAANNFKEQIGQGRFGNVYLGRLRNRQQIAIKVRADGLVASSSASLADAFTNEVLLLSTVKHPHLVSLLGYCQERKHQLLVCEYMSGGTLADCLYGPRDRLDWMARVRIAMNAAGGLSYLHKKSEPKIIHGAVKSTNILLSKDLIGKVSDYGLSRLVSKAGASQDRASVMGTDGYLDPEFYLSQKLTEKSDVYSFGVVLLEIVSGRQRGVDQYSLISWIKPLYESGSFHIFMDKNLTHGCNLQSVKMVVRLAFRCLERNAAARPDMFQVLNELKNALAAESTELRSSNGELSTGTKSSAALTHSRTSNSYQTSSLPRYVPDGTLPR